MTGLKLFLGEPVGGTHLEAVHQRILTFLFRSPTVVKSVLGLNLIEPQTEMETYGKLFDIQINDDGKAVAAIELKMWSKLGAGQFEKQLKKANELGVPMIYILFGYSAWEWDERKTQSLNAQFIRTETLYTKLGSLKSKTEEISKELKWDKNSLSDLMNSYAESLEETDTWLKDKAWDHKYKDSNKISYYASLFFNLKDNLPDGLIGYLYRGGQSSVHLGIGNEKVKILGVKGRLLFWLKDKNLQFFLEQNVIDKTHSSLAADIREILKPEWQRIGKGNSLRKPKTFPEYLCVLSIPYPPFQPDDYSKINAFIEKGHAIFIDICRKYPAE
jgi:hypothetical protein